MVQPCPRLGVAAHTRDGQRRRGQVLRASVVAAHRLGARFHRCDGERIGAHRPCAAEGLEHQLEPALLPAGLRDLLPDASGGAAASERLRILASRGDGLPGQREAVARAFPEHRGALAGERVAQAGARDLVEQRRLHGRAGAEPLACRGERCTHPAPGMGPEQVPRARGRLLGQLSGAQVGTPAQAGGQRTFRRPHERELRYAQAELLHHHQPVGDERLLVSCERARTELRPQDRREPDGRALRVGQLRDRRARGAQRRARHATAELRARPRHVQLPAAAAALEKTAGDEVAQRLLELTGKPRRLANEQVGEPLRPGAAGTQRLDDLGFPERGREGTQLDPLQRVLQLLRGRGDHQEPPLLPGRLGRERQEQGAQGAVGAIGPVHDQRDGVQGASRGELLLRRRDGGFEAGTISEEQTEPEAEGS